MSLMLTVLLITPSDPNDDLMPRLAAGNRIYFNAKLDFVKRQSVDEKSAA
jgi:hypothetical protein